MKVCNYVFLYIYINIVKCRLLIGFFVIFSVEMFDWFFFFICFFLIGVFFVCGLDVIGWGLMNWFLGFLFC